MRNDVLEGAIFDTIRYFAVFDMPVTATQVWRSLITPQLTSYPLHRIEETLRSSPWLQTKIGRQWGYYCLKGAEASIERRLRRHVIAVEKWKIARRIVRWLQYLPFVRMIAGSGSFSLNNTQADSDIDLFMIVSAGRIWTARLLLLCATQLSGRRRKYWNVKAPDKLCLNHYVTDKTLLIAPAIRSIYTAMQYTHLTVLYGHATYRAFLRTNTSWLSNYLTYPALPVLNSVHSYPSAPLLVSVQHGIERWLREPLGDILERYAERVQRYAISRHTARRRSGRIVLSADELAFHPDSKADYIVERFNVKEVDLTH